MQNIYNFLLNILQDLITDRAISQDSLLKFNYILFNELILKNSSDRVIESCCVVILSLLDNNVKIIDDNKNKVKHKKEEENTKDNQNFVYSKDFKNFDCLLEFPETTQETRNILKTLISDYSRNKSDRVNNQYKAKE